MVAVLNERGELVVLFGDTECVLELSREANELYREKGSDGRRATPPKSLAPLSISHHSHALTNCF